MLLNIMLGMLKCMWRKFLKSLKTFQSVKQPLSGKQIYSVIVSFSRMLLPYSSCGVSFLRGLDSLDFLMYIIVVSYYINIVLSSKNSPMTGINSQVSHYAGCESDNTEWTHNRAITIDYSTHYL